MAYSGKFHFPSIFQNNSEQYSPKNKFDIVLIFRVLVGFQQT